jgi:adenosylmethionine-8-amino-7-oxononanoate aminotransferase
MDQLWTRSWTQGWWAVSIARLPGISRSYSLSRAGALPSSGRHSTCLNHLHLGTCMLTRDMISSDSFGPHLFPRDPHAKLLKVSHGHGIYLCDETGRSYMDGGMGAGAACLGHAHPRLSATLACQAEKVAFAHTSLFVSKPLLELSEQLVSRFEHGARVYFVSGGSEGIETALKIARSYQLAAGRPARTQVAARSISYHGATLGALSATGLVKRRAPYEPLLAPVLRAVTSYCYRCPFGLSQPSCEIACAADVESLISRNREELAAVLIEPVIGASAPGVVSPPGYLQRIAAACAKEDVLLIADEVLCGMGRTGRFLAVDHDGVIPDIVVLSKALGAGHVALGAVLVRQRIYDAICSTSPGLLVHGFTYSGTPLAAALGLEVLRIIDEEGLVSAAAILGDRLQDRLDPLKRYRMVGEIRGRGLLIGVEFVADNASRRCFSPDHEITRRVFEACLAEGLIVYPCAGTVDGTHGDQILIAPPFIISTEEIDDLAARLDRAIGVWTGV